MLLKEMFSAIGGPKENDQDIDWIDDLKFYIDNEDKLLNNYFFPAVEKHEQHVGNPNVYKLYLRAIKPCLEDYCKIFNIENPEDKFPEDSLVDLAKRIAAEQENHIKSGDYKKDET
jgi:hypothetical protein